MVGFLFAFDIVLSLWGFDPLVKFSVSFAMYIIVDSYMFRTGEVVCIYVSKYLVVEMELKYLLLISCTRRGLFESGQG